MEQCTVYYDDTKKSCREYADIFSEHDLIVCKKASEYIEHSLIYEESSAVGFVFESDEDNVPYAIRHIMWRIIMDKKGAHFLAVTGGNRELTAMRRAAEELEMRGYEVCNVYSKYMFEKYHMGLDMCVRKIVFDLEEGEAQFCAFKQAVKEMSKKEMRKMLRDELKEYRKYKKIGKN